MDATPVLERVTRATHGALRLKPLADHFHAAGLWCAPLAAAEAPQAAVSFPLAFRAGEDGGAELLALFSLTPGRNHFVSEAGAWLCDFAPGHVTAHPFVYRADKAGGRAALFVEAGSPLLSPDGGEPLFTAEGAPSERMKGIVRVLKGYNASLELAGRQASEALRFGVLTPWGPDCADEALRGLLRVDEAALSRLPLGMLDALRQSGALGLLYAQLVSMALLPRLAALGRMQAAARRRRGELLASCFREQEELVLPDSFRF